MAKTLMTVKTRLVEYFTRRVRAFTLAELLVAASILAVLASLTAVSLNESRKSARDARRKKDISTYVSALGSWRVTNPSFFVNAGECQGPDVPAYDAADPATQLDATALNNNYFLSGVGCSGALGRSFGRLNQSGGSAGYDADHALRYANLSIAEALASQGHLNDSAKDPLSKDSPSTAEQPDYVLIRCCSDGYQSINRGGSTFAVFTVLEKSTSIVDASAASRLCGGWAAAPSGSVYDFASLPTYGHQSTVNLFGLGEGAPGTEQASLSSSQSCGQ